MIVEQCPLNRSFIRSMHLATSDHLRAISSLVWHSLTFLWSICNNIHVTCLVLYRRSFCDSLHFVCETKSGTNATLSLLKVRLNAYFCVPLDEVIDGGFGLWSYWSDCSTSCGPGRRTRVRECDSPEPANGGLDCLGKREEDESCHSGDCPGKLFPRRNTVIMENSVKIFSRSVNFLLLWQKWQYVGLCCVHYDFYNYFLIRP